MEKSKARDARVRIPLELWEMARKAVNGDWRIRSATHFVQIAVEEKILRMQRNEEEPLA
jgi:hypothetical protein